MASAGIDPSMITPEYLAEDTGSQLIATAIAFIIIECIIYFTRLYSRTSTKVPWGKDDLLIVLALLANIAQCILAAYMVGWAGVGQHLVKWVKEDPSKIVHEFQGLLAMEWTYPLAVALSKLAILELYVRIFPTRWFRIACYCTMGVVFATFLATGLTAVFQCSPVAAQWDRTIKGAHCIDELAFFRWVSFPNIVTDLVMLILPIPMILGLHLSKQRKFELLAIFICGGSGLIFSIVRFTLFFNTNAFADTTYTSSILMIITCVEPGVYFICACLPGLRPLLHVARQKMSSLRQTGASGNTSKPSRHQGNSYKHIRNKTTPRSDTEIALGTVSTEDIELAGDGKWDNGSIHPSNTDIVVTTKIETSSQARPFPPTSR